MINYILHRSVFARPVAGGIQVAKKRLLRSSRLVVLLFFIITLQASGQGTSSQDVRYTLSPVASGIAWNNGLGLSDGFFYGGKVGIDFGPLIGLEASYLTSPELWTKFAEIELGDTAGFLVRDQRVRVRRFGGDLILRWPSERLAPFVKVGGGVIRFEPESGQKAEKIDVRFGGGLDYILTGRVRTRAWVEMNRFRLDRYYLAPGGATSGQYPIDPEADKIRNNFSVGLSLDYALGQSRFRSVGTGQRLHPFSALELEPMVGRLKFDDKRMSVVTVAGARIGGELNPWVGWGLYYWHALESDFSDTRPLQSYGGEARFSLASKDGPQPYVTIGAGQLDFRSGYIDSEGNERDDRTALILGAGVRADVFSGLQLNVGVRDFMYGEGRLDRVSGTEEISHNWLLSGAVVFGFGGHGGSEKKRPVVPQAVPSGRPPVAQARDSAASRPFPMSQDTTGVGSNTTVDVVPTGYVSDKNVVIPVPLEGEIYIRYGKTTRDVEKPISENIPPVRSTRADSTVQKPAPPATEPVDSSKAPAVEPSADTTISASPVPTTGDTAPVSRSEVDSLLNVLRSEMNSRPVTVATPAPAVTLPEDSTEIVVEDSTVVALRRELAAVEQERRRLDSLLKAPAAVAPEPDSLEEQRIQRAIAEQVAAALAARPEDTAKEITQADLQNMMALLTTRMDSVTSQRAAVDSARLRDQFQLEIIRQTKSQEEFQRAMENFTKRYSERQDERAVTPSIVVTPPTVSTPVIERDQPSTVIIKPDTQYVVIRDSTGAAGTTLPVTGLEVETPPREKNFIDLRPTVYTGFGLEKPKQFILGGRLDIGPITTKEERLRLVPEFALGLGGGGVSVMAVLNAEYGITEIRSGNYRIVPYARMGFGVLGFGGDITDRDTEGVLNFTYGVSFNPGKTAWMRGLGGPAVFFEHQIIDLFDLNRIVLGLQWSP